ncbi:MAG: DUF4136 domain-containing protein [Gemmatimonadota bacterium]|nr:MAG: DUF4136 domain-containing protein [Gemmatimonadota bacterium]
MKTLFNLGAAAVAVSLAGCSGGLNIQTDYNPGAVTEMRAYRTYNWLPEPAEGRGSDARVNNPITIQRIVTAIETALEAKGFQKVTSDADFKVGWHGAINSQTNYVTYNDYYGYGWGGWGYGGWGTTTSRTSAYTIDQGTLIIDIVDAASNELVWRGMAQAEVGQPSRDPEERQQQLNGVCERVLASFPPRG